MSEPSRPLTAAERRWVDRMTRTLDAMPESLRGYLTPGGLNLCDKADWRVMLDGDQSRVIDTIFSGGLRKIDMGDW